MAYQKTYPGGWKPGAAGGTPIDAAALDHIETQYDEVKAELAKSDGTSDIRVHGSNVSDLVGPITFSGSYRLQYNATADAIDIILLGAPDAAVARIDSAGNLLIRGEIKEAQTI